ncbi:MAG TPA: hypothetical protein VER03_24220 [Bryobacteraceae bacterium]|nr:hypothetical protein [Bryobacteraceae bacterium]
MSDIAGLPFWEVHFDQTGRLIKHVGGIPAQITDLFVFAHAWNNDYNDAKDLYDVFFESLAQELVEHGAKADVQIGLAGVFWPSVLWPGDEPQLEKTGAPMFGPIETHWSDELKKAYEGPAERAAIDRMREMIGARPTHPDAVAEFKRLAAVLAPNGDLNLDDVMGDSFEDAEWALRLAVYSEIATRAIRIGEQGLGAFLPTLPDALHVHLLGHGFGAGLVGSAVQAGTRNVKSLFLMGVEPGEASHLQPEPVIATEVDILDPEVARAVLRTAGVV